MIKVLQDWFEIGDANKFLNRKGLPKHLTAEKNWDLYQLYTVLDPLPRESKLMDLGCGRLMALKLLYAMGFRNLYGVDLSIGLEGRLSQLNRMWRGRSLKPPFHLHRGDLTRTGFPDGAFDIAVCISVIEHGVNLTDFLSESSRILRPGGLLFITTDYWKEGVEAGDNGRPFGLPWKIFSGKDIEGLIRSSYNFGFSPYTDLYLLDCSDRCVVWNNREYTFLCMILKKR